MVTTLQLPVSELFDRESNQEVLFKISTPLKLSWDDIQELSQAINTLHEIGLETLSDLRGIEKNLDYFLTLDKKILLENKALEMYVNMRLTNDYVSERIELAYRSKAVLSNRSKSFVVNLLSRTLSYNLRKTNKTLIVVSERTKSKVAKILSRLEKVEHTSSSYLKEVSPDELWNKRCKAYDYEL